MNPKQALRSLIKSIRPSTKQPDLSIVPDQATGTGESPLADIREWVETVDPDTGEPVLREKEEDTWLLTEIRQE